LVIKLVINNEEYVDARDGLEEYSPALPLFWIGRAAASQAIKRPAPGRVELPVIGIFASRAPDRPNPIGLTAGAILCREHNLPRARGLDASDGAPVWDIKPDAPAFDRLENARTPEYSKLLFERENHFSVALA